MYDLIIIGGGPAGMTAGIYAARKKIKTLLLSKDIGGQMSWSADIENYTGFSMISGADLTEIFKEHLEEQKENLEVKIGVEVVQIEKNITSIEVRDRQGSAYFCKSLIIATGRTSKKLGILGEKEFFGHGVATCATCDAPLYKNKVVAVIGGGNSALDAIISLSKVAKTLYCININSSMGGEEFLRSRILNQANIKFFYETETLQILGKENVNGIKIRSHAGDVQNLAVDGVFVEIGYEPNVDFDKITQKNHAEEIVVDKNLETNIPGIFAAGDVNDSWGEQIIIAAGEGAKAALSASEYLNSLK